MAPLLAILNAVRRAVQRDLGTFESIKVNNFFLFVALLIYGALNSGQPPKSAEPFLLLLGFLLLFPISSDPLAIIPAVRLAAWPLTNRQRFALRVTSLGLSPVLWITVFIMVKTASVAVAAAFLTIAIGLQLVMVVSGGIARRDPRWNPFRYIPLIPGRLGGLIRNNIREMLSLLDPYVAVLVSLAGALYRWLSAHPDPAAFPIMALLVALALSTYAQSLFGLDFGSGMTRYRLLPLRGWEILLAKDIVFLGILIVLILPLSVGSGLTFGLAALAIGHHSSVLLHLPQRRWRFTGGRLLPVGALQAFGGVALGFAEEQKGVLVLVGTAVGFMVSLFWYGRLWEQQILNQRR
ncbi:MAG: hypothetical protein ACR2NN_23040 [Bryobacteraceae bacterium]